MIKIDEIINSNMTITDPKLRDAVHAVCVDVIYAAAEEERLACWNILADYSERNDLTDSDQSLLKHLAGLISEREKDT